MERYTLTAKFDGKTESITLRAKDDGDAMLESILLILAKAHGYTQPWASGEIILTNEAGEIVQTMAEK
ncbi:MAG: hypothetical protein EBS68_16645 [Rhodobacteraceae bacterium]|nr:hypothetical protein [Paracoccaceae bacterium]